MWNRSDLLDLGQAWLLQVARTREKPIPSVSASEDGPQSLPAIPQSDELLCYPRCPCDRITLFIWNPNRYEGQTWAVVLSSRKITVHRDRRRRKRPRVRRRGNG